MPIEPASDLILLVEDELADAMLLQRALRKRGVNLPVVHVSDGLAALDYLSTAGCSTSEPKAPHVCLMILDLKLPKVSGLEVLEQLRCTPPPGCPPVVVLSSSSHPGDISKSRASGASDYLVKPVEAAGYLQIATKLRDYLPLFGDGIH